MHDRKVLSANYWQEVKGLVGKGPKRCAIAFVTQDLIGFAKGDTLVANASKAAIKGGQTSAKLLLELHDRGVQIYDCPNLHGKVLQLGGHVVVGSGNMSSKSNSPDAGWLEAAVATNDSTLLSGVDALIEQLVRARNARLDRIQIEALTKIKVERQGGGWKGGKKGHQLRELGNRTWIAGVVEIKETSEEENKASDRVNQQFGRELEWLRFSGTSTFVKEARAGDSVVILWRGSTKSAATAYRVRPILFRRKTGKYVYLYYRERRGAYDTLSFPKFEKLLKAVGHRRRVAPGSAQAISVDHADAVNQLWVKAVKGDSV
jgi:hypothetical protein